MQLSQVRLYLIESIQPQVSNLRLFLFWSGAHFNDIAGNGFCRRASHPIWRRILACSMAQSRMILGTHHGTLARSLIQSRTVRSSRRRVR